jgi:hypothetical protein
VDPSTLVHSTVGITRNFDAEEMKLTPSVLGIRGTGWFLSPRFLVTAEHVAKAMLLSDSDWKEIEIRERESLHPIPARVARITGSHAEKIAVLELRRPFPGASGVFAQGRFVEYGADQRFVGAALLELYDGSDRLALDHGASGAPVFDCDGRVVAVVSTLITQTLNLPTGAVRVSTAWQTPNVVSMPAESLKR